MSDIVATLTAVWLTSISFFNNSCGIKTIGQGSMAARTYGKAEEV
jgi:hypothetical protein